MAMFGRTYTGGRFGLTVDGSDFLGFVKSVSGGKVKGDLAPHQLGPDNVQKKHITTIHHEPFKVEVGMGMSAGFYEWIRASFDKAHVTKNGEIAACDFDYHVQSVREFYDAHISEVTLPALDGSSPEPAYMTVSIDPERIRYRKGDGNQIQGRIAPSTKKWHCNAFRFELGGLPCTRVSKIDSFTWKQGVIKDQCGAFREPTKHAAKVEVPNLKITISMADVEAWQEWHRTFVIEGICTEADELNGQIEFLGPDHSTVLGNIGLWNVGILDLEQVKNEANKEEAARFQAELYVEKMTFEYHDFDA